MKLVEISVICAHAEEAKQIQDLLLTKQLVACGQTLPIASRFWWEGNLVDGNEVVLLVKTFDTFFDAVVNIVVANHSYDLPAVTMTVVENCSPGYFDWVLEAVKEPSSRDHV